MSQVKKDILNGWKEIAAYVARDRRTVERWEKLRGLPVRRMPGEGRATVYALISELDEWLASSKPDETETENAEQGLAKGGARGSGATGSGATGSAAGENGARQYGAGAPEPGVSAAAAGQNLARDTHQNPERNAAGHLQGGAHAASAELFLVSGKSGPGKDRLGEAGRSGAAAEPSATNSEARSAMPGPSGTKSETGAGRGEPGAGAKNSAAVLPPTGRWEQIAGLAILLGLGIIFVLATPDMRRSLNIGLGHKGADSGGRPSENLGTGGSGSSSELGSAQRPHSQVPGVDDLYLEGVYSLEQRTPESLERARQDFASAIQKDAHYAPAYAALANTYILLREYYVMPDEEAYTKAKAAAEQAIALDPRSSEGHASLGFIDFFWLWNRVSAEQEFRTAIADDPTSAHAHHWYGSVLTHEGRFEEATEQLNIAQRLEPTSAAILSTRALALGLSGHRGEAVEMLEGLINESPGVSSPHAILAILSKVEPADWGKYLEEMRRTGESRHSDETLQVAAAAEPALRSGGERGMWTAILATEEKLHPGNADRTFLMAEAEAALGRDDAAIADLNQLAQRHEGNVMGVIIDPTLAPLRRDRRFGQLLAAVGLPTQ